ncbi:MAG: hypothetical protein IJ794_15800 [Lachnospiraceae bacterium]|nr:hypothetical protein [Lachnospiraceae bacterium]
MRKGMWILGMGALLVLCACGAMDRGDGQEASVSISQAASEESATEQANAQVDANAADEQQEEMGVTKRSVPERMVMAKGTLYVDTGYVSGIWGRCGNLDGNIDTVISSVEIPVEDGQANFEAAGWQMGFEEDTIEVPIDGEFCIFAAQGSKKEGYIPASVAQFFATVEEVTEDGYVIVRTNMGVSQMFSGKIKENERYKISLEHYECDINIPVESLSPGNILCVICKNNLEDTDPAVITDVYSVSPLHENVCQPCQYPPADEVTGID